MAIDRATHIDFANRILSATHILAANKGFQLPPALDPDLAAFAARSGATDLDNLNELVVYLKQQSLWSSTRFFPMKSAQNAGSGATLYGLGGLTSNNMTLVNTPTWGASGTVFNSAGSQYGTVADCLATGKDLNTFLRGSITSPAGPPSDGLIGQWPAGGANSFLMFADAAGADASKCGGSRSSDGTTTDTFAKGSVTGSWGTDETTWVAFLTGVDDINGYINKTDESLTRVAGTGSETTRFNSSSNITVMAQSASTGYASGTVVLAGFIEATVTATQRGAITDLINAL